MQTIFEAFFQGWRGIFYIVLLQFKLLKFAATLHCPSKQYFAVLNWEMADPPSQSIPFSGQ